MRREPDQPAEKPDRAVYVISIAAELAGVHPQTLRIYERKQLLKPKRTSGNSRRYSQRDVEKLQRIQHLTQEEGVNLAGVRMIMDLEEEVEQLQARVRRASRRIAQLEEELARQQRKRGVLVRLSDVRDIFGGER